MLISLRSEGCVVQNNCSLRQQSISGGSLQGFLPALSNLIQTNKSSRVNLSGTFQVKVLFMTRKLNTINQTNKKKKHYSTAVNEREVKWKVMKSCNPDQDIFPLHLQQIQGNFSPNQHPKIPAVSKQGSRVNIAIEMENVEEPWKMYNWTKYPTTNQRTDVWDVEKFGSSSTNKVLFMWFSFWLLLVDTCSSRGTAHGQTTANELVNKLSFFQKDVEVRKLTTDIFCIYLFLTISIYWWFSPHNILIYQWFYIDDELILRKQTLFSEGLTHYHQKTIGNNYFFWKLTNSLKKTIKKKLKTGN